MKFYVKYDLEFICNNLLRRGLDDLDLNYHILDSGAITIDENFSEIRTEEIRKKLQAIGISILQDPKEMLVQQIKDTITEMLENSERSGQLKVSSYLTEKLPYSYSYLSALFSEITHTSIENFVILKKIDIAKTMLTEAELTLTEVAYQLNYSSVSHLSYQFKKTTGLTPSQFQNIIRQRGVSNNIPDRN
ncbi:helix-turn-helix domain-containing protein [Robertkochia solimangrovi]|uniref:helix-turn-helix domain-containing protein n=1 Tax=Robertkochia solimangrovi TaxID=2213046 RepID=UPI001180EAF3|nr:AraC family transcriptional regulator [Robertkochia solimangrovi]TRZ42929.1 AraC family transcriptional regulator [Robertkochia solimangrovi]